MLGEGRILVPRIGLPALWVHEHPAVASLALAALSLCAGGGALAGRLRIGARRGVRSTDTDTDNDTDTRPVPAARSSAPVQLVTSTTDETELVARRLDGAVRRGEIIDLTVHRDHPGVRSGGAAFAFSWASGAGTGAGRAASEDGASW